MELTAVDFKKDEKIKTVTISTITDTKSEPKGNNAEYFWFELFKSKADANDDWYTAHSKGYIEDDDTLVTSINDYIYSILGANNSASKAVKEGEFVTFTISRTREDNAEIGNSDVSSLVYISTSQASAYEDDYVPLALQALEFKKTETQKTITIKTKKDTLTDDVEYFWLNAFKTKADAYSSKYAAYDKGYIANDDGAVKAAANYSYSLSSSSSTAQNGVTEGSAATFTITRSNSAGAAESASTIYISATPGTASKDDFEVMTGKAIEFKANENQKTITVLTKQDAEKDDGEYFYLDVFKSLSDLENNKFYKWQKSFIKDDATAAKAVSNYNYTISTNSSPTSAKFSIIDASNIAANTTLTVQKNSDNAVTFTAKASGASGQQFNLNSSASTPRPILLILIIILIYSLCFWMVVTVAVTGGQTTTVTSGDTDRIIQSCHGRRTSQIYYHEPGQVIITTKVYLHTSKGTAGEDDFEVIYKQALEFKKNELVKTVSVNTKEDGETDDGEHFALELYKTEAAYDNGDNAAYGRAFNTDNVSAANAVANYNYAISGTNNTEGDAASEGSDNGTKSQGPLPVLIYHPFISTTHSTTGGNDFVSLDKQALTFKADELSKTVIMKTNTIVLQRARVFTWIYSRPRPRLIQRIIILLIRDT